MAERDVVKGRGGMDRGVGHGEWWKRGGVGTGLRKCEGRMGEGRENNGGGDRDVYGLGK